jgi:type III pantothenate kinase
MTLLVEAGDGVLKWAPLADGPEPRPGHVRCLPLASAGGGGWPEHFHEIAGLGGTPQRVLIANQAGPQFAATARSWLQRAWQVEPQFAVASGRAAGVTTAALDPATLGIGRWLGLVAAGHALRGPVVVANAAADCSVDLIHAGGRHAGGCVVPGELPMRTALFAQTSAIAAATLAAPPALAAGFGVNTAGAVQQGARLALAALIERALLELGRAAAAQPSLVLTGSAVEAIAALLGVPFEQQPDLVLCGLALLAAEMHA